MTTQEIIYTKLYREWGKKLRKNNGDVILVKQRKNLDK